MIVSTTPSRRRAAWDRSMLLPSPSTPSVRFARDVSSQTKARAWVEAVIGRRLPEGDFAAGFKDGVGLCELVNVFKPGTIAKVETSASPFHQMANISCFLRACRALGVREQVLFETLDLFNENRLSQVVRCLFSLSELVRTTIPSFSGPYLEAPEKPEVDPAVLHLVDLAKGNIVPAPAWGGEGPGTPDAVSTASSNCGTNKNSSNGAAVVEPLSLPKHDEEEGTSSGCCLSPAAQQAGKLTFGIYEGGGVRTEEAEGASKRPSALVLSPGAVTGGGRRKSEEDVAAEGAQAATVAQALDAQLEAEDRLAVGGGSGGGGGRGRGGTGVRPQGAAVEYAESALTVVNTPRAAMPTPKGTPSREPASSSWRTPGRPRQREEGGGGDGEDDGDGGSSGKTGLGMIGGDSAEDQGARKRKEATAQRDTELEVALWIEGVTGETFPGKFWSSLKDGVVLCNVLNSMKPGLVAHVNTSRGTFPELENISAFLSGCRKLGVAEHSLFNPKDLHEKRDMRLVVRCLHVLGAAVQTTLPDLNGPFLGKKSEALSIVNARGLRKRLGKGPGARGGIHTFTAVQKGGGEHVKHVSSGDIPIEHPDPTATMTPAESPSAKRGPRRRDASDSAAGSGGGPGAFAPTSPRAVAEGVRGALLPSVILEEEAGMTPAVVRVERDGNRGARVVVEGGEAAGDERRNLSGLFAEEAVEASTPRRGGGPGARTLRWGASGNNQPRGGAARGSSSRPQQQQQQQHQQEDDGGEDVVSQIQGFVELHTRQPWRISGNMYESLRDGWQLALLANALRPGAVRRVHNSIQPAKQVQNIAHFLIACRRMGVARVLLFDIEDLYENKSKTKVARTLLALRALAADPDFARARPSSLMGTSLLVTAAASAAAAGLTPGPLSIRSADVHR